MPTSAKIFSAIVLSLITCVAQVASAASAKDKAFLGITGDVYTIRGTLNGLNTDTGNRVVLRNNDTDELIISHNGVFQFRNEIAAGKPYKVTVEIRPLGQYCTVSNGEGVVNGPVSNVAVVCEEITDQYGVGGTVLGLFTDGLVLTLNGSHPIAATNGAFIFPTKMASGSRYEVSISQQPNGQSCVVDYGTGTIVNRSVTNVIVLCNRN